MWQNIPPLALAIVYESLPIKYKLSASATCQRWREVLFDPRITLLEKLDVKLSCCSSSASFDFIMSKKTFRQARKVSLEWNSCNSDLTLSLLDSLVLPNNQLRELVLRPRFQSYCKKACRNHPPSNLEPIQQKLKVCILRNKKMKSISLGYSQDLCAALHDAMVIMMQDGELGRKMESVNFSYLGAIMDDSLAVTNITACLGKCLSRLSFTWDYNLESYLNTILAKCPTLQELDLTAETGLDSSRAKVSDQVWLRVKKVMPHLKIGLNIVETVHQEVSFPFTDLLTVEIPVQKYEVVFQNTMFAIAIVDKALMFYLNTIERIGIHYVEKYRDCSIDQFFIMYLFSKLTVRDCRKMKELCLSGYYITDGSIMQFLTRSGVCPLLEKFLISKHDIVSQSQNSPYFIKLTSSQIYGLERAVSVSWGKDWKALTEAPVQRKIKYKQENIPEIFQYVLQNNVH